MENRIELLEKRMDTITAEMKDIKSVIGSLETNLEAKFAAMLQQYLGTHIPAPLSHPPHNPQPTVTIDSSDIVVEIAGAQVISQHTISSSHADATSNLEISTVFLDTDSVALDHGNKTKVSTDDENEVDHRNLTTDKLMKAYESCIVPLRNTQAERRVKSLKNLSSVNFTKEVDSSFFLFGIDNLGGTEETSVLPPTQQTEQKFFHCPIMRVYKKRLKRQVSLEDKAKVNGGGIDTAPEIIEAKEEGNKGVNLTPWRVYVRKGNK